MVKVFEKTGLNITSPSIFAMIKHMDTSANNEIGLTFDQFMNNAATYFSERRTKEGVSRIFKLFDP